MFNIHLDYPSFDDELTIVKNTTSNSDVMLEKVIHATEIQYFQKLIRSIPITDHVLAYAVKLAAKTRPNTTLASDAINNYVSWGAGPRASQFLVLGAKCHAAISGKYAPDIEDVQAVAEPILRHRIVRNYRAEAEGLSIAQIIKDLF